MTGDDDGAARAARRGGRVAALLFAAVVTVVARGAEAQRFGAQRFVPAVGEDSIFETEGADRRVLYIPYVALWLGYAWNPLVLVDDQGAEVAAPVEHLLAADLVATVTVWEGLELGVGLPLSLYSWGDDEAAQSAGIAAAPGFAVGDLVLRVGYRQRLADHTALALHVPVLLPTSSEDDPMAYGVGARPTVALLQRLGPVELLVNLYFLFRGDVEALDYRGGHEMGLRVGARIALTRSWRTSILAEIGFSTALADFFSPATTPAEGRIGAEHWFGRNLRLVGFVGTGTGTGAGATDLRAGLALAYGVDVPWRPRPNPRTGDRDGDGILDASDRCPTEPEDPDGYEDEDGCPDDDNDRDGILDWDDGCPSAPETMNGISDGDGCPDLITVEETLITTFDTVHFRTGSEEILERSFPMLREIAGVLAVNPGMRVRVEGHTDSVGDADENLELSQHRAESVRRFLIEAGAPAGQLEARGYGETRPIAPNTTPEGRSRNRRVDFHIVGDDEEEE